MDFTANQVRKLRSKLRPQHIRTRQSDGVTLSYLEGWHVVAEANRIFGFGGWDCETIASDCVWTKQVNGRFCAAYVTRIRIRVRAGDAVIVREGSGAGESNAASPGQAHEFAAKAAETDATKRALMTFGNAFGLSLYGGAPEARHKPANGATQEPSLPAPAHSVIDTTNSASSDGEATLSKPDDYERTGHSPSEPPPSLPVSIPGPGWPTIQPLEEDERLNRERCDRVDKSALALGEPRRIRNAGHLAFVASKPCLICGRNRAHAHHLKFAQPTALGRKVSDEFTVPLCPTHHRELHSHGDERIWWAAHKIDALKVAEELWKASAPNLIQSARSTEIAETSAHQVTGDQTRPS